MKGFSSTYKRAIVFGLVSIVFSIAFSIASVHGTSALGYGGVGDDAYGDPPETVKALYTIRDDATGGDCASIGTWDASAKKCTMTKDITVSPADGVSGEQMAIIIAGNGIILDGNGHSVTYIEPPIPAKGGGGAVSGSGFFSAAVFPWGVDVTVENLTINDFKSTGIQLSIGSGHNISGNTINNGSGTAINLIAIKLSAITNNNCVGNYGGIRLSSSDGNSLTGNTISNDQGYSAGIDLTDSSSNTLTGNIVENGKSGGLQVGGGFFSGTGSSDNFLDNNQMNNNPLGLQISAGSSNIFRNNKMTGNAINIRTADFSNIDYGGEASLYQDIDTSNLVDGKPVYYLIGASGQTIDAASNAGVVYCIECDNMTIKNLTLSKNHHGVFLYKTTNSSVENLNSTQNLNGIVAMRSDNNTIKNNIASNNADSSVSNGTYRPNGKGIFVFDSRGNLIDSNTANANHTGLELESVSYYIFNSGGNTLINNKAENNKQGLYINNSMAWYSDPNNILSGNKLNGNETNFKIDAQTRTGFVESIDKTNLVDGKPIYYLLDQADQVVDQTTNAGVVYCINCQRMQINNLSMAKNDAGVYLFDTTDSTVENITSSFSNYGIYLRATSSMTPGLDQNNMIKGNTVSNNRGGGISVWTNGNTLKNNTATQNRKPSDPNGNTMYYLYETTFGIDVLSGGNTLDGNSASDNDGGVKIGATMFSWLPSASEDGNTLKNNSMSGNEYNFWASERSDTGGNHSIDTSNTTDGKPVYYLIGATDKVIDSTTNAGAIYCFDCENLTVKDVTISNNFLGIYLWNTRNSSIQNVDVQNNGYGVYLENCDNNELTGSTINLNRGSMGGSPSGQFTSSGISLTSSTNNTFTGNNVKNNKLGGVGLAQDQSSGAAASQYNVFASNDISENQSDGITLMMDSTYNTFSNNILSKNGSTGVQLLQSSNDNIIEENAIFQNEYSGIELYIECNNNVLRGNTIEGSRAGLTIVGDSGDNEVYKNNFKDNETQIQFWSDPAIGNIFQDPIAPNGGNYWSDFDTTAEGCIDADADGFCDAAYIFDGGQDNKPFATQNGWRDNEPPSTTNNAPAAWQKGNFSVTLSCVDTGGSGCAGTHYKVDEGPDTVGTSVAINTEGDHTITYHSVDIAGNVEPDKTVHAKLDKTVPTVSGVKPSGSVGGPSQTVEANLVDTGGSVISTASAGITLDGGLALTGCTSNATHISCPATGLALGAHSIAVTVSDNAGNTGTGAGSFNVTPVRDYYWARYDGANGLDFMVMGNPPGAGKNLNFDLSIGCVPMDLMPFTIAGLTKGEVTPGQSLTPVFLNKAASGPVKATSTTGDPAIASQRILWKNKYFEEVAGIESTRLSSHYLWTWYDEFSPGFSQDEIIIVNTTQDAVTVDLSFTDVSTGTPVPVTDSHLLQPACTAGGADTWSVRYHGKMGGPVEVKSYKQSSTFEADPRNVIATQRVIKDQGTAVEHLNEVPGTPYDEISSHYYWTWYDWKSPGAQNYVLAYNPGPGEVTVEVSFTDVSTGSPVQITDTHDLAAGAAPWTPFYPGKMGGPVEVKAYKKGSSFAAEPRKIIASQRSVWSTFFEEVPGLPQEKLSPSYLWTWYDWKSAGSQNWVMVANPNNEALTVEVSFKDQTSGASIGGTPTPLTAAGPGASPLIFRYDGKMGGPLEVKAYRQGGTWDSVTDRRTVISSQRVLWNGQFNETLGTVVE